MTCPVAWQWTTNVSEADVVWANILEHGSQRADELRAYPGQLAAFMSLEPVTYYSFLYDMKTEFGYDFSVDYRIWDGHSHGKADIPAVFLHNPYEEQWGLQNLRKWPTMPKRKDAAMAVFISNCGALNNRNELVNELMEHLSVHSYGQCWHNKEVENPDPSLDRFTEKQKICGEYHFLFASENSNEDAYVTEKVYDALLSGALPVYLGSHDINRYIPDPSAIVNVADFPSVAALAEYLIELTNDEEKYLRHFEWKKREFSEDFKRVLRLAARTVQCRLAMKLEGLDFESDLQNLEIFPPT